MIDTLILDLDGPILDGRFRHYQCYCGILMEHGFKPIPMDIYWEMKRQRKDRHAQLAASEADGIYEEFLNAWLERIEQKRYLKLDRLQPGAYAKLKEWRTEGMNMILATMRNNQDNLRWQLDALNLTQFFDVTLIVGTANGSAGKASAVKPFVEQAGASSVLWIGDTEVDIEAARSLGVATCLVGCGLRFLDYLATLTPNYLLPSLALADFPEMGAI